jgi:hypothetical protein
VEFPRDLRRARRVRRRCPRRRHGDEPVEHRRPRLLASRPVERVVGVVWSFEIDNLGLARANMGQRMRELGNRPRPNPREYRVAPSHASGHLDSGSRCHRLCASPRRTRTRTCLRRVGAYFAQRWTVAIEVLRRVPIVRVALVAHGVVIVVMSAVMPVVVAADGRLVGFGILLVCHCERVNQQHMSAAPSFGLISPVHKGSWGCEWL